MKKNTKLNLHGVKHEDVRQKVIDFIESYWDTNTELQIITGNSKPMRDIVMGVIEEYKLDYTVGDYFGFSSTYITTIV